MTAQRSTSRPNHSRKPLKIFDAFSGVGGFRIGLERAGMKCAGYCENDKYAKQTYDANFNTSSEFFWPDATTLDASALPEFDILCGGFPCFPSGTPVFTLDGFKPIEEVVAGDRVLTHTGRFCSVVRTTRRHFVGTLVKLTPWLGILPVYCTPAHPILSTQRFTQSTHRGGRPVWRTWFTRAEWLTAKNITKNDFVVIPLQSIQKHYSFSERIRHGNNATINHVLPTEKSDFWYLVGFYLAEGERHKTLRRERGREGEESWRVRLSVNRAEAPRILTLCRRVFGWASISHEETADRIHIARKAVYDFFEPFGSGAENKRVPGFVHFLKPEMIESLVRGYFDGDGCIRPRFWSATTVSPNLAHGIQRLLTQLDRVVPSVQFTVRPRKYTIQHRTVNQRDTYRIVRSFYTKRLQFPIDSKHIAVRIRKTSGKKYAGEVFNLEVESDNSYTVSNFVAVHNCQSFSLAGHRRGFDDARGTLFFELARILRDRRPPAFLFENVQGLVFHDKGRTLKVMLDLLAADVNGQATLSQNPDCLGYHVYWKVLNSKDFGVPQNRKRIFIVGFRDPPKVPFEFPVGEPLTKCLADVLEKDVPQKYYLSDKLVKSLLRHMRLRRSQRRWKGAPRIADEHTSHSTPVLAHAPDRKVDTFIADATNRGNARESKVKRSDTARTVAGSGQAVMLTNLKKPEPSLMPVGNIYPSGGEAGKIYDDRGLFPTVKQGKRGGKAGVPPILAHDKARVKRIGDLCPSGGERGRVYDPGGISPTIKQGDRGGGAQAPAVVIQLVGDRDKPGISIKDIANTVNANPMSDRQQAIIQPTPAKGEAASENDNDTVYDIHHYHKDGKHEWREHKGTAPTLDAQTGESKYNVPIVMDGKKEPDQSPQTFLMHGRHGPGGGLNVEAKQDGISHAIKGGTGGTSKIGLIEPVNTITGAIGRAGSSKEYLRSLEHMIRSGHLRRLTPRECFALQGFPDSFKIDAVSASQAYREAGNAVTVNVVEAIGKCMLRTLRGEKR